MVSDFNNNLDKNKSTDLTDNTVNTGLAQLVDNANGNGGSSQMHSASTHSFFSKPCKSLLGFSESHNL